MITSSAPAAVFLSYASKDAEAARRLAEALRAAGVEVWFDQNELQGGDAWDAKIRRQIAECALFVPVISAATQARREGYFRIEWKLAAQRSHAFADGTPFILPVVIDATRDADALVPAEFKAVQWTRLPGGVWAEKFCARVAKLLGRAADSEGPECSPAPGPAAGAPPAAAARPARRRLLAGLALGGVALAVALVLGRRPPPAPAPSAPESPTAAAPATPFVAPVAADEKSLVVLPLENLSPDPANAYFTDGVHAEIIGALVPRGDLKVISRGSALAYRGSTLKLEEIGRQLDVAFAISGNVRRAGDRVRIQLEMRRVRDEVVVWSRNYDRPADDIFAIQTEIGADVARALQLRELSGTLGGAKLMTRNPKAYELFVQAREVYISTTSDARQLSEVVALLERALAADPEFTSAMDLLSRTYTRLAIELPSGSDKRAAYGMQGLDWAEKVSRLLPGGIGDGALAYYYSAVAANGTIALEHAHSYLRALPKEATAYNQMGMALSTLGRYGESMTMFGRARELDPRNQGFATNLIGSLLRLRRLPEAESELNRFYALFPNANGISRVVTYRLHLGADCPSDLKAMPARERLPLLAFAGRFEELRATCVEVLQIMDLPSDERAEPLRLLALAESRLGRADDTRRAAAELLAVAQSLEGEFEGRPTEREHHLAWALHFSGRRDEALAAASGYLTQLERMDEGIQQDRRVRVAELYAQMRETDKCVALLTELLKSPTRLTLPALQREAIWAPVRDEPRFQALLQDPATAKPL